MVDLGSRRRLPTRERRELILAAALELFGRRGYEAVGMRDVAAACEISATGIYRHFPNKEALLIGLFDRLSDQLAAAARAATRIEDPVGQLAALIEFHVHQVLREPRLIPIYQREEGSLPATERDRVREVLRTYLAAWLQPLTRLRPDLRAEQARTTIVCTFGMLNSNAYHHTKLTERALRELLIELSYRTLGLTAPASAAPPSPAHRA